MRRGRKRKPLFQKQLEGNRGKRKLNDAKVQIQLVDLIASPVVLDRHGRRFFNYFAARLKDARVLSELDIHALALGARWWSIHERAMKSLQNRLTQKSRANGNVARAEITIAKQAFSAVWSCLSAFGLNPSDRSRLQALELDNDDDPAAEFFDDDAKPSVRILQ